MKTKQTVSVKANKIVTEIQTRKLLNKMDKYKRAILNLKKSIIIHLIKANNELEKWGSAAGSAIRN